MDQCIASFKDKDGIVPTTVVLQKFNSNKKKEKRPLISSIDTIEEMKQFINKHYFERRTFYSMATHSITSNRNDSKNVVKEILSLLN